MPHRGGADVEGLLRRAQQGDRRAFDALLLALRPRAIAAAHKVLRNPDDAEDAVQEGMLKMWRYLPRFEGRSSLATWLHRIVMNSAMDLLRRRGVRFEGQRDDGAELACDTVPAADHDTPEAHRFASEAAHLVRAAIDRMPRAQGRVLELRELEDCTYQEIARAARCPVGTVMSRLHHARHRLTDELRAALSVDDLALRAA